MLALQRQFTDNIRHLYFAVVNKIIIYYMGQ